MFRSQVEISRLRQQQAQLLHEVAAARQAYQAAQTLFSSEYKQWIESAQQHKKNLLDKIDAVHNEEDVKHIPTAAVQLNQLMEDFKKLQSLRQGQIEANKTQWQSAKERAKRALPEIQESIQAHECSLLKEMFMSWRNEKTSRQQLRNEQEQKLLKLNQARLQKEAFVVWRQRHVMRAAFFLAVKQGDVDQTEYLLKLGIDINSIHPSGYTPLILAIIKNQFDMVRWLLENHANPNKTASITLNDEKLNDITPLLVVIRSSVKNKERMIEVLLSFGAKMNFRPPSQPYPPLHAAVLLNSKEVVKTLLANKANPNVLDSQGRTLLEILKEQSGIDNALSNLFHSTANPTRASIKPLR